MAMPKVDPLDLVKIALEGRRKLMGEGTTLLQAARACHDDLAERHRKGWESTQNPIWVWRCMARLNSLCIMSSSFCPELFQRQMIGDMPAFCSSYLLECAYRVEALAGLKDFRAGMLEGWHAADGPLSPEQALSLVPAALQFSRRGKNAFRDYAADDLLRLYLDAHDAQVSIGDQSRLTNARFTEALGLTDVRNARRRRRRLEGRSAKRPPLA